MNQTSPDDPPPLRLAAPTTADTLALGRRLAGMLRAGDIVLLVGPLGAGKTLLAGGIAEGLGVRETVVSPSFILARRYEGFLPLLHADVYRLSSMAEFDDLELPTLAADGVLLIEWGNVVAAALPDDRLVIEIVVDEDETRHVTLHPHGSWWKRPLGELVA